MNKVRWLAATAIALAAVPLTAAPIEQFSVQRLSDVDRTLASDAFDAYVFVSGPGIGRDLPQDDDSGGHCNARLTVRLPGTGAYHIAVTSQEKFATGPFTLSVTLGPRPVSLARCDR